MSEIREMRNSGIHDSLYGQLPFDSSLQKEKNEIAYDRRRPARSPKEILTEQYIVEECEALKQLLLSKNRAYGNSATDPVRIMSDAEPDEQIRVRLDDKISRIVRGHSAGEDVEQDLSGYLILLRVCRRLDQEATVEELVARKDRLLKKVKGLEERVEQMNF